MDADPRKFTFILPLSIAIVCFVSCTQTTTVLNPLSDSVAIKKSDSAKQAKINSFIDPDTVGKRTLYLTFDDGPNNGTPTVINILKEEQVPATFFLIGMHDKEMPIAKTVMPILRSMPNVELCNHSYTHAYKNHFEKFYADLPGSLEDFRRCQDTIGFTNDIARTPGNNIWRTPNYNQTTFARYKPDVDNIRDSGFVFLGWDAEWRFRSLKLIQNVDQMEQQINEMYDKKENKYPNHCVLLMHDLTFLDAVDSTSLHELIKRFKANPLYRFDIATNHPLVQPNATMLAKK